MDADYFAMSISNCQLVPLDDMLQNGTVIAKTKIDTPNSFRTACNIATQISAAVGSNQYGGQTISLTHLAPFVEKSRQKNKKEIKEAMDLAGISYTEEQLDKFTEKRLRKEIADGVQTIQYQYLTLSTTNGQSPFITIWMYLDETDDPKLRADLALIIEEMLKQRIKGIKNEFGAWISPAFPKLVMCISRSNCDESTPYWYLTELAAECTAKRMVPDYVSEKIMLQYKIDKNGEGHCYPPMGCRSFLTPYVDENGKPKYYGRLNQGVVTINLPYVALLANKDLNKFWEILDHYLEVCHKGLQTRHNQLVGVPSDVSPIHWQHGSVARLKPGEKIDKYLYNGYSTISLGFAGLWECVRALNGHKLTEQEGEDLGLQIMKKLNEYTAKWKAAEHMDYSLYGTPLESCTYKFAKAIQKRFGIIEDVSDKSYVSNSYHIKVTEEIDAFDKLTREARFQRLSPGGAISYVEVPNMVHNIPAVLAIIKFIYNTIMYAELNTKLDYCAKCDYEGEIALKKDEHGKLVWECPQCGCRDERYLTVVRRTCGYIGSNFWNQGRTEEIGDRYVHVH